VLRNLFSRSRGESRAATSRTLLSGPRYPRHSSGWGALLKHLKTEPGLRVLDIGPTSPTNINFLTGMGHSVYMADVVHESLSNDWSTPPKEEGGAPGFDVPRFFQHNLNFEGRQFDVVLLWTTMDYIPADLIAPLLEKLHGCLVKNGKILAIFHTKVKGPETAFCRYHLTDADTIEMQESEPYAVQRVYTNRNIEKHFAAYSGSKFFLAKDNIYEVIITR
jgi:hypothetical protein